MENNRWKDLVVDLWVRAVEEVETVVAVAYKELQLPVHRHCMVGAYVV